MYVSSSSAMATRRAIENGNILQQPSLGAYLAPSVAMARRSQIENPHFLTPGIVQQPGLGRYHHHHGHGRMKTPYRLIRGVMGRRGGVTDQCSGLWNDVRQDAPQLSLAQFLAKVPQCRPALKCGDNRLSDGSIVPIACVAPLPVARTNNYQFLGDLASGTLDIGGTSIPYTYIAGGFLAVLLLTKFIGGRRGKRKSAGGSGVVRRTTTTFAT